MAKTQNPKIDIYMNEAAARAAFSRETNPCHLLHSPTTKSWYIDRSKSAFSAWPLLYKIIDEK